MTKVEVYLCGNKMQNLNDECGPLFSDTKINIYKCSLLLLLGNTSDMCLEGISGLKNETQIVHMTGLSVYIKKKYI